VLQWLCNRDKASHAPFRRLKRFFQSLYDSLVQGARAVLQFYPEGKNQKEGQNQIEMITAAAMQCGFSGGIVVDFPHSTKAKKYYLVLNAGPAPKDQDLSALALTGAAGADGEDVEDEDGAMTEGGMSMTTLGTRAKAMTERGTAMTNRTAVEVTQRAKDPREKRKKKGKQTNVKGKAWVLKKKDQMRDKGKTVAKDSKYTARNRKPRF